MNTAKNLHLNSSQFRLYLRAISAEPRKHGGNWTENKKTSGNPNPRSSAHLYHSRTRRTRVKKERFRMSLPHLSEKLHVWRNNQEPDCLFFSERGKKTNPIKRRISLMKSTSMAAISQSKISQNHIYQMAFGRKTNIRSFFGYRCTVFPSRSVLLVLSRRSALSPPVLWLVPPFHPYSNWKKKETTT